MAGLKPAVKLKPMAKLMLGPAAMLNYWTYFH
jgi:hypothetical protein